jgi:hypothetical protein
VDPDAVTAAALDAVAASLTTRSGDAILLLSRWANADTVYASPARLRWAAAPKASPRPRPRPLARAALDTLVRVASNSALEGGSNAELREGILSRFNRVSGGHVAAELSPPPRRVWAMSDVHIDVSANLDHCLALPEHPDDALVVAGDVGARRPRSERRPFATVPAAGLP